MTRIKPMYVCLLLVLLCSPALAREGDQVVRVTGTGVVSAKPDRARLLMHVTHLDRSVVAAKRVVDDSVIRVQKMLLAEGVKPEDINSAGLNVHEERTEPIYRDGNRDAAKQISYRVSRTVTVNLENVSKLDVILDKALSLGTNSVQNVEFYSSRIDEITFEAMRKASEDARKKADFLAKQFDRRLGKAQQIEYGYSGREPQGYMLAAGRAGAPSFLQGTMDVTATVNVVYEIE